MVNGQLGPIPQMAMANPVVAMLEEVLKMARAGQVSTVAVIGINAQGGVMNPFVGHQISELHTGAALLQDDLRAIMRNPQPKSSIIPVRVGG